MNQVSYVGRVEKRIDGVSTAMAQAMAATLDRSMPLGDCLPPLWHWMLFQHWAPARELAGDGHPKRGGFLPAEPALQRRMWAGGRLLFHQPLRLGETVTRTSTITRVEEKLGASGRLLFVTLQHIIEGRDGIAITEEQDIVYRGEQQGALATTAPPVSNASRRSVTIDTPLLFRYSALTGNAHRIHYDRDYAQGVEGYADLVVHGPLQATLLAGFAADLRVDHTLKSFAFRGRHPALLHRCPLMLEAWTDGEVQRLRSLDANGVACTTVEAEFTA